ncbi:hypothetical protein Q0Z83_092430 [Actinoplanes sichuanensis]|nr:hypothetical protein Q0Z83_092430 [Actinoplanes sichuanensis]
MGAAGAGSSAGGGAETDAIPAVGTGVGVEPSSGIIRAAPSPAPEVSPAKAGAPPKSRIPLAIAPKHHNLRTELTPGQRWIVSIPTMSDIAVGWGNERPHEGVPADYDS